MTPKRVFLLLLLVVFLAPALPIRAQTADLTDRLPADTLFYFYSRGAAAIPTASPNALVSLWNDPGFAPARQWIAEGFAQEFAHDPQLSRVPATEWEALLRDPFVIGARLIRGQAAGKSGAGGDAEPSSVVHGFLVLAASGRQAQDARAALLAGHSKKPIHVGVLPSGYVIAAQDRASFDSLVRRFAGAPPSRSNSLPSVPAFQEARRELTGSSVAEWFLRVPDIAALEPRVTTGFNTPAFLDALELQRIHLLCGSLDLTGPAARIRGTLLGDTAPGSVFDLFGSNTNSFSTLAAAPAGASVSISRLDIPAAVTLAVRALAAAMPPQQAGRIKMMVGMFSPSILPVLGGEYASIRPHAVSASVTERLTVISIHHQPAEQLFQSTLAPFVHPEGKEGEIEYFRTGQQEPISGEAVHRSSGVSVEDGHQQAQGERPSEKKGGMLAFSPARYFLALTPNFLVAGQDEQSVRTAARSLTAATPTPGLAADPYFRSVRAELPAELSGLGFYDLREAPWALWIHRSAEQMRKNKKDLHAAGRADALEQWTANGGAAVLARHLHVFFIGAWKDSTGVHWSGQLH